MMQQIALSLIRTLVLAFPMTVPALAQDDLPLPEGPLGQAILTALGQDPGQIDWAALRTVYAASPGYSGRSALWDSRALTLMEGPEAALDFDQTMEVMFADFPLMETQFMAMDYFRNSAAPAAPGLAERHQAYFLGIFDAIRATERQGPDGPVYSVLSVSEQYMVLAALGVESRAQALVTTRDGPQDCHTTAGPTICFDISAFFGR